MMEILQIAVILFVAVAVIVGVTFLAAYLDKLLGNQQDDDDHRFDDID